MEVGAVESFKSQFGQDKILLSLLGERRGGFFVELGAGNGVDLSNSYYFEKALDWKGLLIEPDPQAYDELVKNRNSFISNKLCGEDEGIEVDFLLAGVVSGIIGKSPGYWIKQNIGNPKVKLKTTLLSKVLEEFNCPKEMGFLSLDVEGEEFNILKTFPFDVYSFDVICVEHNSGFDGPENRDSIRDLLINKRYRLVKEEVLDDFYMKEGKVGIFDGEPYTGLKRNRIEEIVNHFGGSWFKGKKILELGCGYADIGNVFYMLGANVVSTDARKEHLEVVGTKYPHLNTVLYDLNNKDWPFDLDYDLIINTGILYHLEEFEQMLGNCFLACKNMFLESIVSDSDDPCFVNCSEEEGFDQSFTKKGCRPSVANVERIIQESGFSFERCFNKNLNVEGHLFDWEPLNSGLSHLYVDGVFNWLRRAWFCTK